MPSGSLLDMDGFVRNVVGIQNLSETRRRNDIYEQNSLLQAEQIKVDRDKIKQQNAFRAFDEIGKMAEHPALAQNTPQQIQLLKARAQVMAVGLGREIPLPDDKELAGGFTDAKKLVDAAFTGTPDEKKAAFAKAVIANPVWGRAMMDNIKKAGELTTELQELDLKLQTHQADLRAKNLKIGRMTQQDELFSSHVIDLTRATNIAREPKYAMQFQVMMGYEKPESRQAYMNLPENQEFAQAFTRAIEQEKKDMEFPDKEMLKAIPTLVPTKLHKVNELIADKARELADAQAKSSDGTAPQELAEEVQGLETVRKARQIEIAWLEDPTNKDKWKALGKAKQDLTILQGSSTKKLTDLASQRDALNQLKFDQKTQSGLAETYLQDTYLDGLLANKSAIQAHQDAIRATNKKFPDTPYNPRVTNPETQGKLAIDVNTPTTATRTKMQEQLTGLESTLNVIGNLKATVRQGNIGLAAALKSTAYGFTSQIKGMAETVGAEALSAKQADRDGKMKGFTPSKWFDPSLSTVDLLANTLAYRIINQEQGGRVSDKDFAEMKKRLNIDSWMAGKEDVLQRLTVMEDQLKFEQKVYRRVMPTFGKEAGPSEGAAPATAVEWLRSKGIEIPAEGN